MSCLTRKNWDRTKGVGLGRTKVWKGVTVGSGVNVLLGVDVKVAVGGIAAMVCVDAAPAVCTMNRLIALGSSVGTGVTMAGAHARVIIRAMNQIKIFFPGSAIIFHL